MVERQATCGQDQLFRCTVGRPNVVSVDCLTLEMSVATEASLCAVRGGVKEAERGA